MTYVRTQDGTNLYVKDWGRGRPVLLIHGWPLSADSWDDVALALADDGHRAIAYDRRGFGRSDQPYTGYDYDTFADDLARVMEETDATDAALIGFSMGGGEVVRYLARHGTGRVSQAALVGSVVPYVLKTPDNPEGTEQAVFDAMKAGIKADRPKFFATFFKQFFGAGLLKHPVSDELLQWASSVAMQAGLKGTLDCIEAFSKTDFRPDLAAVTVPTLIIHGTGDKVVPIDASGRAAARALPRAKLIEYEGAPHGLFATHKEALIKDLRLFVETR